MFTMIINIYYLIILLSNISMKIFFLLRSKIFTIGKIVLYKILWKEFLILSNMNNNY